MSHILGLDHVAITAANLDASCAYYEQLFGATVNREYASNGKVLVRQLRVGEAGLSIHQSGNGLGLAAEKSLPGTGDICFRWKGSIDSAVDLLRLHAIPIIEGPVRRHTADGRRSKSVYFRDLDKNLIELMAAD